MGTNGRSDRVEVRSYTCYSGAPQIMDISLPSQKDQGPSLSKLSAIPMYQ